MDSHEHAGPVSAASDGKLSTSPGGAFDGSISCEISD
jgi:hypothetical protein